MLVQLDSSGFEQLLIYITLTFLIAVVSTAISIPMVNSLGLRLNVIDQPDHRKQHKEVIVRLGGLGIFLGFSLTLLFIFVIGNFFVGEYLNINKIVTIVFGTFTFYIIGTGDDFFTFKPLFKLFLQIILATIVYSIGINFDAIDMSWLNINIEPIVLPKVLIYLISILWIIGITNAINWLDGLDGLASGIATFTCLGLIILFLEDQKYDLAFILAALCGSSVGFLRFNFYPAKILMGDGGSYLLGSTLSIISILGMTYNYQSTDSLIDLKVLPIHILILLFFLPILDLTSVIFTRIIQGYSPFYPDRRHIHHKLLKTGMFHRDTVVILYGFSQLLICISLYISKVEFRTLYLCISLIISILSILYCINMKRKIDSSYEKN